MDTQSAKYLQVNLFITSSTLKKLTIGFLPQSVYMTHNIALEKLLKRLGYPIPLWLEEELSDRPVTNNQAIAMPDSV